MNTPTTTPPLPPAAADLLTLAVQPVLAAWAYNRRRTDELLALLSDAQLEQPVAPGRNRGTYLLGHLIAIHDAAGALLGMGERRYAAYDDAFVRVADGHGATPPDAATLRRAWAELHERLTTYFGQLTPTEWFERHAAVTAEEFATQPHRNRLALLTNRNTHFTWHLGQLWLLKGGATD